MNPLLNALRSAALLCLLPCLQAESIPVASFATVVPPAIPPDWVISRWAGNGPSVVASLVSIKDPAKNAVVLQAKADFTLCEQYWGVAIGGPAFSNPLPGTQDTYLVNFELWSPTAGAVTVRIASQNEQYKETGFQLTKVQLEAGKWTPVSVPLPKRAGATLQEEAPHLVLSVIVGNAEGRAKDEPVELRLGDVEVKLAP